MEQMKLAFLLYIAVNGHLIHFGEMTPTFEKGQLFVPARPVLERMEASVTQEGDKLKIKLVDRDVTMQVGSQRVVINGQSTSFSAPPQEMNGTFMIPLRATMEAVGVHLSWIDTFECYRFVSIKSPSGSLYRSPSEQHHTYSPDRLFGPRPTGAVSANTTVTRVFHGNHPAYADFEAITEDGILLTVSQLQDREVVPVKGMKLRMTGTLQTGTGSIFKAYRVVSLQTALPLNKLLPQGTPARSIVAIAALQFARASPRHSQSTLLPPRTRLMQEVDNENYIFFVQSSRGVVSVEKKPHCLMPIMRETKYFVSRIIHLRLNCAWRKFTAFGSQAIGN
jgi:hypothetical protein